MDDFKIISDLSDDKSIVTVADITDYTNRASFGLAIFWSYDAFVTTEGQNISMPNDNAWMISVTKAGTMKIAAFRCKSWVSGGSYAEHEIVHYSYMAAGSGNQFPQTMHAFYVAGAAASGNPVDGSGWTAIASTDTAAVNYALFVAANTADATQTELLTTTESVDYTPFSFKKTDDYTYEITGVDTTCYYCDLYSFGDFINDLEPLNDDPLKFSDGVIDLDVSSYCDEGENYDDIYILKIYKTTGETAYLVIYAFDGMRSTVKTMIKEILCNCNQNGSDPTVMEARKRKRMFLLKTITSMFTMIGMIHSEKIDHFHYFDMDESRKASLTRANDILQKVKLMMTDLNCPLTCNIG